MRQVKEQVLLSLSKTSSDMNAGHLNSQSSFIVIHENPLEQEISFRFDSKRHFLPVTFPQLNIIEFSLDVHHDIDRFLKTNILPLTLAPMHDDLNDRNFTAKYISPIISPKQSVGNLSL